MWTGLNNLIAQNQVHEGNNIQNIKGSILIDISGRFIIIRKDQVHQGNNIQYI